MPAMFVIPLTLFAGIALIDLFRRVDLSRRELVGWALAIVLIPLIGPITYLLRRPPSGELSARAADADVTRGGEHDSASSRAAQLRMLANLHDGGKLTDAEFAAAKVRVLRDNG